MPALGTKWQGYSQKFVSRQIAKSTAHIVGAFAEFVDNAFAIFVDVSLWHSRISHAFVVREHAVFKVPFTSTWQQAPNMRKNANPITTQPIHRQINRLRQNGNI